MTRRNKLLPHSPEQAPPVAHPHARGSASVELAFARVVLMTSIFAIMDFSRAMYDYHFISNAAREATRYASVRGSTSCGTWGSCPVAASDVSAYVKGLVPTGMFVDSSAGAGTAGYLAVNTTWQGIGIKWERACSRPVTRYPGCIVQIQIQYTSGFTLPYVRTLGTMNLSSTSQFTVSQ